MPYEDHERRISTVEANVNNILTGINDIKLYLVRSSDQRTTMIEKLAVISSKQDDMKEYQEKCDNDREQQENRLNTVENYQSNQRRNVAGIAAIVGVAITGGGKIIEKIGAWLS